MYRIMKPKCTLMIILLVISFYSTSNAQEKKTISIDWIYSSERSSITSIPSCFWLEDGSVILNDTRLPVNVRTFEKFDPETENQAPMLDMRKALNLFTEPIDTGSVK